jgi:hypothetical protein
MSRYSVWLLMFALLAMCKLFGIGDGSVFKEAYWAGSALLIHWFSNRGAK